MKAVVYDEYGPPEVLRYEEIEVPTPAEGEVLVRVRASSVNSWDWDLLTGSFQGRLGYLAFRNPRMRILGADVAGVVEAIGTGAKRFRPGDAVFGDISGSGWGGFAEYVSVSEQVLAPKSEVMSFEKAAALPQAGVLALQGLRRGGLDAEKHVLLNGAGGGVGTLAVQIAKSAGAEVTGVDSRSKLQALRSLGADHVIDYAEEDWTRSEPRYDLVLDVVARGSMASHRRALRPGGRYVAVGGSMPTLIPEMLLGWLPGGGAKSSVLVHRPNPEDLMALNELYEGGQMTPVIEERYPLPQVPEALRRFGERGVIGKLVITT